jgi:hypothetical protein
MRMGKSCCEGCVRARRKLEHPELIECKLHEVPADRQMAAYYGFMEQRGVLEEPFRVVADLSRAKEHAWPFQFDPAIIVECAGYRTELVQVAE